MNSIRIAFRDFLRPDTKEDASAAFRALSEQLAGFPATLPSPFTSSPEGMIFMKKAPSNASATFPIIRKPVGKRSLC